VLRIVREADGFTVEVGPPHSHSAWSSPVPLTATQVLEELSRRGCHSTDITDALYEADPNWGKEHDAEVHRGREGQ